MVFRPTQQLCRDSRQRIRSGIQRVGPVCDLNPVRNLIPVCVGVRGICSKGHFRPVQQSVAVGVDDIGIRARVVFGDVGAGVGFDGVGQTVGILVDFKGCAVQKVPRATVRENGRVREPVGLACLHRTSRSPPITDPSSVAGADLAVEEVGRHLTARPSHQLIDPKFDRFRPAPSPVEEGIANRCPHRHDHILIKGSAGDVV